MYFHKIYSKGNGTEVKISVPFLIILQNFYYMQMSTCRVIIFAQLNSEIYNQLYSITFQKAKM